MPKLSPYPDFKQHANNYLFQVDSLVRNLYELKYSLTEVLFDVESKACHCHSLLDEEDISFDAIIKALKKLPASYSKGFFFLEGIIINFLKQKKILSEHYKIYSAVLAKKKKGVFYG
jgi:hypothetical protein